MRLADMPESERAHMLASIPKLPEFGLNPWVPGGPLSTRRVAIVTSSGIHARGDRPFGQDGVRHDYRVIPSSVAGADLVMSHMSVNFDRFAFQQDVNVVFPLDRLKEFADQGIIGSVADFHYSFMGALAPVSRMEATAREVGRLLKQEQVDAVLLTPV